MAIWFWYAVAAAILYGAHQIFTRLAAERIGDGLGGFVVEASAALSILIYLAALWFGNRWNQLFWPAVQPSWRSPAFCFFTSHRRGPAFSALPLRSSDYSCCANDRAADRS